MHRARLLVALAAATFAFAGCGRHERGEPKVHATSPKDFSAWRARLPGNLTPDECREFDDAVQEIKFEVMRRAEASGSAAIDAAARARIDGRTVREALAVGYDAKLRRLEAEHAQLEGMIQGNATLRTNPGDTASADYLRRKHDDQSAHLKKLTDEIAVVREKRARTGVPFETAPANRDPAGESDSAPVLLRQK